MTVEVKFYNSKLDDLSKKKDVQVILGALEKNKLTPAFKSLTKDLGMLINETMTAHKFKSEKAHYLAMPVLKNTGFSKICLQGMKANLSVNDIEELGGSLYDKIASPMNSNLHVHFDDFPKTTLKHAESIAHLAYGSYLKSHCFEKYFDKKGDKAEARERIKTIYFYTPDIAETKKVFANLQAVADGVMMARDLVFEPPNVLYPEVFANECKKLSKLGVKVTVFNEAKLKKIGMDLLLSVGHGSARESYVAIMEYNGHKKGNKEKPVAFVGKGVTFDTGGVTLKPGVGMWDMKFDMGGAAAVAGLMKALAGRKANVNAVGIIGLTENMISDRATRPSDVVKSLSGQTVEILNTDAEGRLVLADILTYVQNQYKPKTVINLATLTGAIIMALGYEYAGLFSNNDKLAQKLIDSGQRTEDKLWRMPLHPNFDKTLDSSIADIQNVPTEKCGGGSITAAQFLQRFIQKDVEWAHLDIAGTAWQNKPKPLHQKGATGFGVRLLNDFVKENFEK